MTTLAELIAEGHLEYADTPAPEPLYLFQEALEFFQRCLSLQEYQFTQLEAEANVSAQELTGAAERSAGVSAETASEPNQPKNESSDEDHWATIVEPVTRSTLLDTLLAQVETLTSLCGLLSDRGTNDPNWVEQYYQSLLQERMLLAAQETGRQREVALAKARFKCALADADFGMARLDIPTYEREISTAYEEFTELENDAQALCDRADAELAFDASVWKPLLRIDVEGPPADYVRLNVIRWKHLTKALDNLTTASKLPDAKNLSRVHLRRGDCEMHRRSLGAPSSAYDLASKSAPILLKNAEIYYRSAARLAQGQSAGGEEWEASIKEAIVIGLSGNMSNLEEKIAAHPARVQEVIKDMVEEGVVSTDDLQRLGI